MQQKEIFISVGDDAMNTKSPALALSLLQHVFPELVQVAELIATPANDAMPAIGEYWPGQGGIFAGVMRGRDGHPDYPLIVPIGDNVETTAAWGGYGKDSKATSRWDGAANTKALVEKGGHPAAEWAAAFEHEGHTDWHLPSQAEQAMLMANVPELFSDGWYWSSSQRSALTAFYMDFVDGFQYDNGKDHEFRVRPVRRFIR